MWSIIPQTEKSFLWHEDGIAILEYSRIYSYSIIGSIERTPVYHLKEKSVVDTLTKVFLRHCYLKCSLIGEDCKQYCMLPNSTIPLRHCCKPMKNVVGMLRHVPLVLSLDCRSGLKSWVPIFFQNYVFQRLKTVTSLKGATSRYFESFLWRPKLRSGGATKGISSYLFIFFFLYITESKNDQNSEAQHGELEEIYCASSLGGK